MVLGRIDPLIGKQLGNYRLEQKLGQGSCGVVYLAMHSRLGTPFAVKILHPILANNDESAERFLREAQTAARIGHENIVFIADFDIEPAIGPYFVMEYLEGLSLRDLMTSEGPLSVKRITAICDQICHALAAAHASGVVHRDLKPANIHVLPRSGRELVKILDFGIAKLSRTSEHMRELTRTGRILGTPRYFSPEQAQGREIDHRSDIYSFGIILYELLVGKPPFDGRTPEEMILHHMAGDPPPLDASIYPSELQDLMNWLLAKKPDERPDDMEEVWSLLKEALPLIDIATRENGDEEEPEVSGKPTKLSAPSAKKIVERTTGYLESAAVVDLPVNERTMALGASSTSKMRPVLLDLEKNPPMEPPIPLKVPGKWSSEDTANGGADVGESAQTPQTLRSDLPEKNALLSPVPTPMPNPWKQENLPPPPLVENPRPPEVRSVRVGLGKAVEDGRDSLDEPTMVSRKRDRVSTIQSEPDVLEHTTRRPSGFFPPALRDGDHTLTSQSKATPIPLREDSSLDHSLVRPLTSEEVKEAGWESEDTARGFSAVDKVTSFPSKEEKVTATPSPNDELDALWDAEPAQIPQEETGASSNVPVGLQSTWSKAKEKVGPAWEKTKPILQRIWDGLQAAYAKVQPFLRKVWSQLKEWMGVAVSKMPAPIQARIQSGQDYWVALGPQQQQTIRYVLGGLLGVLFLWWILPSCSGPETGGMAQGNCLSQVSISSKPTGATVWESGKQIGQVPYIYEGPCNSKTIVRLKHPDYETKKLQILFPASGTNGVFAQMQPRLSFHMNTKKKLWAHVVANPPATLTWYVRGKRSQCRTPCNVRGQFGDMVRIVLWRRGYLKLKTGFPLKKTGLRREFKLRRRRR